MLMCRPGPGGRMGMGPPGPGFGPDRGNFGGDRGGFRGGMGRGGMGAR